MIHFELSSLGAQSRISLNYNGRLILQKVSDKASGHLQLEKEGRMADVPL